MGRISQLLSIVAILQVFGGFPDFVESQGPGQSLQAALDALNEKVDNAIANFESCTDCSERLTTLEGRVRTNAGLISTLQSTVAELEGSVTTLEALDLSNRARIDALTTALNTERARMDTMVDQMNNDVVPGMATLRTTTERLENVNKIWRNNFKIVNNTFIRLRQKVQFKLAPISLGLVPANSNVRN